MESPDGVREHQRGVLLAVTVLVVTTAIAVVIGMLLLVGCAVKGATTGIQDSGAAPPDAPPDPDRGFESRRATTSLPPASPTTTPIPPFVPGTALCIGDSVMLGASPQYYDTLTMCGTVDATVSRAWSSAASALQGRPLPDRVVVHLGTNGYTDAGEIDAVLSQLASVPRVVLVNVQLNGTRRWEVPVNAEIESAAQRWPNVRLADWQGASNGHRDYFRGDNIHPSQSGALVYAGVIAAQL
jgi:hypothetical protein